jgi:hypothetical protein
MDIEIEPAAVIPATVEDELMEYEDDAAIDVDEPVAPADGSAEASGEEDTEMSDELESATVVELEMREPVPDVEVVIAPEVVLADAEGQDGGVEEESPDVAVEEPVAVQVSHVEADEAQAVADAALEEEHVEDGAEGEPDVEADNAVVATEISPEEAAGASTEAPPAEPHEPMGNEFFEYGLHDGSGDEALHASGSDYYEEEGDSDSIPPIILHLPSSQQRSLFSATTEDDVVLLEGRADDLCHVSLVELLDALRAELGADDATESELGAGEMVLEEAEMGLRVGEVRSDYKISWVCAHQLRRIIITLIILPWLNCLIFIEVARFQSPFSSTSRSSRKKIDSLHASGLLREKYWPKLLEPVCRL